MTRREAKAFCNISQHKTGRVRMRWLKRELKKGGFHALLARLEATGGEQQETYHSTRKEALESARSILSAERSVGQAEAEFSVVRREQIFAQALELETKGIDPFVAMRRGAAELEKERTVANKTLGHYWPKYFQEKQDLKIDERRLSHLKSMAKKLQESSGLMSQPIKVFLEEKGARRVIINAFKNNQQWEAKATRSRVLSGLKLFVEWIAETEDGEGLSTATIKEAFNKDRVFRALPAPSAPRENVAATIEQVKSVVEFVKHHGLGPKEHGGLAGWLVAKMFMGCRTDRLHGKSGQHSKSAGLVWRWNHFDIEAGSINIPKNLTKNKRGIQMPMSRFPNLKAWLAWARKMDRVTESNARLCNYSDTAVGDHFNKWVNEHKKVWAVADGRGKIDLRRTITVGKSYHNLMRGSFLSYGLAVAHNTDHWDVDDVSRMMDDYKSHDSYEDIGISLAVAKAYFGMRPDELDATLD